MKFSRVVIKTRDYRKSFEFYHNTLGLKLSNSWQRKDSWGAIFSAGSGIIEIIWFPSGAGLDDCNYTMERAKIDISFEVNDIDILYRRLSDSGVTVLNEPSDMPWGYRIFSIQDPDRIRITFLQPLE